MGAGVRAAAQCSGLAGGPVEALIFLNLLQNGAWWRLKKQPLALL